MQKDEAERQEAAKKLQDKAHKTQAFRDQRQALMKELEDTRAEIACHEAYLKVGVLSSVTAPSLCLPIVSSHHASEIDLTVAS